MQARQGPINRSLSKQTVTLRYSTYIDCASGIMKLAWKRLIRFLVDDGQIHYGEPDIDNIDELANLYKLNSLTAKLLHGDLFDPSANIAQQSIHVKKILGPLEPAQVPLVKGIGLNYISHSPSTYLFSFGHERTR